MNKYTKSFLKLIYMYFCMRCSGLKVATYLWKGFYLVSFSNGDSGRSKIRNHGVHYILEHHYQMLGSQPVVLRISTNKNLLVNVSGNLITISSTELFRIMTGRYKRENIKLFTEITLNLGKVFYSSYKKF